MRRSAVVSICALTLTLAASGAALAQAGGGGEPRARGAHPSQDVISIEFRGGNVGQYLERIADAAEVNIVVDEESKQIPFEPVTLKSTTVAATIELLDGLESPDGHYGIHVSSIVAGAAQPIYRVRAVNISQPRGTPPMTSHVWSLAELTKDRFTAEAVLSAIEMGVELQGDLGEPQLRYHEDTQILIARAHPSHIGLINEIIGTLAVSARMKAELEAANQHVQQLADEVAQAHAQQEALQAKTAALALEREQLAVRHQEVERSQASARNELERAEAVIHDLRAQVQALSIQLAKYREESGGRADDRP